MRTRSRAGKEKIWQPLNDIAARLITSNIESTHGEAHVRGIGYFCKQASYKPSCWEFDGGCQMPCKSESDFTFVALLPFKRLQIIIFADIVDKFTCIS